MVAKWDAKGNPSQDLGADVVCVAEETKLVDRLPALGGECRGARVGISTMCVCNEYYRDFTFGCCESARLGGVPIWDFSSMHIGRWVAVAAAAHSDTTRSLWCVVAIYAPFTNKWIAGKMCMCGWNGKAFVFCTIAPCPFRQQTVFPQIDFFLSSPLPEPTELQLRETPRWVLPVRKQWEWNNISYAEWFFACPHTFAILFR